MNETLFHEIDAYLADSLSPTEREAFTARLAADPALQAAVAEQAALVAAIEAEGARQVLASVMQAAPVATPVRPLWQRLSPYLAVAATLALLLAGWWLFQGPANQPEALYAAHFQPAPGLPTTLGAAENLAFAEGMVAYKRGTYAEALAYWEPLLRAEAPSDTLRFFAGVATLAQGQPVDARFWLEPLSQGPGPYQAAAQWYTALAYLQQGQGPAARPYLQALAAGESPYAAQAGALWEALGE